APRRCRSAADGPRGAPTRKRPSVLEQAPDDPADRVRPAALRIAAGTFGYGRMEVSALKADAARPGEAVEHKVAAAAQESGLEAVHLLAHLHRVVAVDPAARLDVDRLSRV